MMVENLVFDSRKVENNDVTITLEDSSKEVTFDFDELKKLRAEFEAHRDHVLPNLNDLNTTMPTKADKSDLEDLENRLMEQMRDAIA